MQCNGIQILANSLNNSIEQHNNFFFGLMVNNSIENPLRTAKPNKKIQSQRFDTCYNNTLCGYVMIRLPMVVAARGIPSYHNSCLTSAAAPWQHSLTPCGCHGHASAWTSSPLNPPRTLLSFLQGRGEDEIMTE